MVDYTQIFSPSMIQDKKDNKHMHKHVKMHVYAFNHRKHNLDFEYMNYMISTTTLCNKSLLGIILLAYQNKQKQQQHNTNIFVEEKE